MNDPVYLFVYVHNNDRQTLVICPIYDLGNSCIDIFSLTL